MESRGIFHVVGAVALVAAVASCEGSDPGASDGSGSRGGASASANDPARDGEAERARGSETRGETTPATPGSNGAPDAGGAPAGPTSLPAANGPCPAFVQGQDVTFTPAGVAARKARIWIGSEAQTKDGPLVFYFHGTGMAPTDATSAIGQANVAEIVSMGGLVVAPYADPSTDYPWFASNGMSDQDDHLVIDEIVACAIQTVGVDTRHIHATGLSAGGMLASDLSLSRSSYFASVSPHSGGFDEWSRIPTYAAPGVKMALMLFHGGDDDHWENRIFYEETSEKNADLILQNGGFVVTCDHGRGHTAPRAEGRDAMWQFFKDHPFDSASPYATGLPSTFPAYCRVGK